MDRTIRLAWHVYEEVGHVVDSFLVGAAGEEIAAGVKVMRTAAWTVVEIAAHCRQSPGIPEWPARHDRLFGQVIVERCAHLLGEDPATDPWI